MQIWEIVLIAFALSMDAFAVSVSNGICMKDLNRFKLFMISLFFGVFQGIMPIIGYFAGSAFCDIISVWDHWVAFALLSIIGGKSVIETIKERKNPSNCDNSPSKFSYKLLTLQAVATSIDALAVGIGFSMPDFKIDPYLASLIIASITFVVCLLGVTLGKKLSGPLLKNSELIGGIILILIGLKILLEHILIK